MVLRKNISDEEIEEVLGVVAHLIESYGEKYWPIFELLESELEKRRSRAARLQAFKTGSKNHPKIVGGREIRRSRAN